jgi:NitT/TauT family transport system permease protein
LCAVPLGLILGRNPLLNKKVSPLIYLLYPLPKTIFLPVIILMMGLGNTPKIVLIFMIVFFQLLVNARDAASSIPRQWILTMKSMHTTTYQTYIHLVWPACLPSIFTALRISIGTAISVLFLAETFAASDGLGYFILDAMEKRDFENMYSGIMAMGIMGTLGYTAIEALERRYCHWKYH